jgi:large subunit ribosomal protein L28
VAKRCQLTGTGPQFGHNVSHSNRKTHRRFDPNLQKVTLYSNLLRRNVGLRVTTRAIRSVSRLGGLDAFLLGTLDQNLAPEAQHLKRQVLRAQAGKSHRGAAAS